MSWIKRNLFFVISGAVAVALLGLAGFFLFVKLQENREKQENLNSLIAELNRLNSAEVHPSDENIQAARRERQEVAKVFAQLGAFFAPVTPPAPAKAAAHYKTNPTDADRDFKKALETTIFELQKNAGTVGLPPKYDFTFSNQKNSLHFPAGSAYQWMVQLGEIRAICDTLFAAKITSLEGIQRIPVSADEPSDSADYLHANFATNLNTIGTPYRFVFNAFSAELADVLNGFAHTTNSFIVRQIMVEPSRAAEVTAGDYNPSPAPLTYVPKPVSPGPPVDDAVAARYGALLSGRRPGGASPGPGGGPRPAVSTPTPSPFPTQPTASNRPQVVGKALQEKPLRIQMIVEVVKLKTAALSK